MPPEERVIQARILKVPEATEGESQTDRKQAEDNDDRVSSRLGKVARELAFKNGPSIHVLRKLSG